MHLQERMAKFWMGFIVNESYGPLELNSNGPIGGIGAAIKLCGHFVVKEMSLKCTCQRSPLFESLLDHPSLISSYTCIPYLITVTVLVTGDYDSAVDMLRMAITLIKQSVTAGTETSQILIQSLQDCLHGIEEQVSMSK